MSLTLYPGITLKTWLNSMGGNPHQPSQIISTTNKSLSTRSPKPWYPDTKAYWGAQMMTIINHSHWRRMEYCKHPPVSSNQAPNILTSWNNYLKQSSSYAPRNVWMHSTVCELHAVSRLSWSNQRAVTLTARRPALVHRPSYQPRPKTSILQCGDINTHGKHIEGWRGIHQAQ